MNRLIVVHTQPEEWPVGSNQASVCTYAEATMGSTRLVVENWHADVCVKECAILGYVNELGIVTQIASIDEIATAFGFEECDIASELREATRRLVSDH